MAPLSVSAASDGLALPLHKDDLLVNVDTLNISCSSSVDSGGSGDKESGKESGAVGGWESDVVSSSEQLQPLGIYSTALHCTA
jgi:hypothetical protein